jgi:hypothetical protein
MSEGKDRIETIDQWTRTTAGFSFQTTIQEKYGVKYGTVKCSSEFQGRNLIFDASSQRRSPNPTPPFSVEYVLLNPFSVFDDRANVEKSGVRHTGLTIAEGCADKWIEYFYTADKSTNRKTARISWQSSEGQVNRLIIELDEPETIVLSYADVLMAGVLDYICFAKEIPLSIQHIEIFESKTHDLLQLWIVVPYLQKVQLNSQLLFGAANVPNRLVPLLRLFREAVNSTNPYYRLLCLYRIGEGLKTVKSQNNQAIQSLTSPRTRPKQRIPENEFTKEYFRNWIGKSMHEYLDHVERNFRKYIAHLIIDESLKFSPDPGSTKHAVDTDKVNGMLISIIRQLIYDEWSFMKENGIDGVAVTDEQGELGGAIRVLRPTVDTIEIIRDLKAKGEKILKTSNVEIVRANLLETTKWSAPYEFVKGTTDGQAEPRLYVTFTVESISSDEGIIIRAQLENLDSNGQLVKSFYDRRIQVQLPPVGVPQDYDFKLVGENFETPPVHFKCVVLEHAERDNITLAAAFSIAETKS